MTLEKSHRIKGEFLTLRSQEIKQPRGTGGVKWVLINQHLSYRHQPSTPSKHLVTTSQFSALVIQCNPVVNSFPEVSTCALHYMDVI